MRPPTTDEICWSRTYDGPALVVVVLESKLHDVVLASDVELLIDLVLDGEAVGIPSEPSVDVVASRVSMSGDNVLRDEKRESS